MTEAQQAQRREHELLQTAHAEAKAALDEALQGREMEKQLLRDKAALQASVQKQQHELEDLQTARADLRASLEERGREVAELAAQRDETKAALEESEEVYAARTNELEIAKQVGAASTLSSHDLVVASVHRPS